MMEKTVVIAVDGKQERTITRTFQMENTSFDAQLEFLELAARSESTSALSMHIIFRSVELRDRMVKMGMSMGDKHGAQPPVGSGRQIGVNLTEPNGAASHEKSTKIAYGIFTVWLALGMIATGIVQLLHVKDQTDLVGGLGFLTVCSRFSGRGNFLASLPCWCRNDRC